jgi:hypothetical protein
MLGDVVGFSSSRLEKQSRQQTGRSIPKRHREHSIDGDRRDWTGVRCFLGAFLLVIGNLAFVGCALPVLLFYSGNASFSFLKDLWALIVVAEPAPCTFFFIDLYFGSH